VSNKRLTLDLILSTIDKASAPLKKVMRGSNATAQQLKAAKEQLAGLQRQQKDISSFQQLSRATKESRTELGAASEHYRRLQREIEATANPSRKLTREFERAGDKVGQLRNKHIRHLQTLKESKRKLSEAGIDVRNLSQHNMKLSQDIDTATQAMRRQQKELDRLTRRQERARAAAEQFSSTQEMAGKIAGAGAGAAAMGGGITYGAMNVIQPGMEFDAAMSQVQALTRLNKESEEYIALRKQARELGATTSFSASDAAAGQGYLAMAGFTPQAIVDAMPGMLSLAKAAGVELGEAADIGSNILTGFNLTAADMGRAGDVLTATFTRSNTDLQMLGETMKYVAPVASGLGGSLEEAAAMAGKLGDAGIQGSMGGTALRAIYSRMAAPPKAAADALDDLGIRTKDAQGNLRPMTDLLTELHDKTKDLGAAQRAASFKAIAGEEAFSALAVLTQQAGSGKLQELIKELQGASGEANRTAAVMADNASGDIKSLQSAWQDVAIELTDLNDGPLRGTIQMVTDIVRGVGNWIKENPELAGTIAKVVVVTGGLLLGFGSIALAISALMGPFAMMRYVMTMAGLSGGSLGKAFMFLGKSVLPMLGKAILWVGRAFMMNPIGLVVTAIAAAAYLIYKNWEPIKAFFSGLWQEVKAAFDGGLAGVGALLLNWSPIGLLYNGIRAGLGMLGIEMPAQLSDVFGSALSAAGNLLLNWNPISLMYTGIQKGLGMIGIELPAKFTEFGGNLIQGLINGITGGITQVKDKITSIGASVSGWFKDVLGINSPSRVFASHGGDVMAGLQLGMGNSEGGVIDSLVGIGGRLLEKGRELAGKLRNALGDLKNSALDKLNAAGGWLGEKLGFNDTAAQPALAGAGGVQFDNRPALQPRQAAAGGNSLSIGEIHVHAAPGMDAEAVARMVALEVQKLQLQQAAGARSNLRDED
jgi:TP901 family phage tail tape measure protein